MSSQNYIGFDADPDNENRTSNKVCEKRKRTKKANKGDDFVSTSQ
ncbi:hypothetical protein SDC9_91614 [bioreactor metagenome]|uniref:Uncharacterized protein n=1 Tax=bioreactor metagenome TaxID=1076179 RepID=A0A644ZVR5_9ZZZZ